MMRGLMHSRRFTTLVLGLWIGITAAMLFVAINNFRGVDRLLEAPHSEAARMTGKLGSDAARQLLRYQASELNRFFFDWFGLTQIALSVLLAISVLFATNGNKLMLALTGILILLVLFEKFLLVPEITYLGRTID